MKKRKNNSQHLNRSLLHSKKVDSDEIIDLQGKIKQARLDLKNKEKEVTQVLEELGHLDFTVEHLHLSNEMMCGQLILDQFCDTYLSNIPVGLLFLDRMELFFEKSDDKNDESTIIKNEIQLVLPIDEAMKRLDNLKNNFDHLFFILMKTHKSCGKVSENLPYIFYTLDDIDRKLLEILKSQIHKKRKLPNPKLRWLQRLMPYRKRGHLGCTYFKYLFMFIFLIIIFIISIFKQTSKES